MKILISGGSGFVGSNLLRRLVFDGHDISVLIKKGSNIDRLCGLTDKISCYESDLGDEKKIYEIVQKVNPQIIYHLAANQASPHATNAEKDIQTNIIGTWNLLKSLSCCNYQLFINAGSSSEYGFKNFSMSEKDVLEPNSYHSFSKGSQTNLVQCYGLIENKPVITLRFFSVYGPSERKTRLIPSVVDACINKKELKLSSPETVRDFVYVDDVIDICTNFDKLGRNTGQIFNVGTGIPTTIKKVVDIVSELSGFKPDCIWNKDNRSWDSKVWFSDCEKTKSILEWQHSIDIVSGLEKTLNWFKNERDRRS